MPAYRSLFAIAEFRVLFVNRCVVMISVAASGLALGTITFEATRSPVLTGLSMFGGPLVSLVTSQLLLGASDAVRPRTALLIQMAAAFVSDAPQLVPGLPWQARFALMAIPYAVNSMFSGTQWVVVRDIVGADSFVLARSAMNLAIGGTQVAGYGIGGLALLWLSPRGLFAVAAVADLACLVNVWLGIRDRPARGGAGRAGGSVSGGRGRNIVRRTAAVNRRLIGSRVTRPLYLALWVPSGLITGCESLFVPYGHPGDGGHRPVAGYLFAATAAGMMAGDLLVGRFVPPRQRDRLIGPLQMLLAVPYLFFLLSPPVVVAVPLGFLASAGYAAALPLQERLIRCTGDEIQGQVMGLYSQGMMAWQSLGALIAGAIASWLPPARAMSMLAAASVAVTIALIPGPRRAAPAALAPPPQPAASGGSGELAEGLVDGGAG
ncbi:MAG TPA: MFS transporter [Trebonia sp.]